MSKLNLVSGQRKPVIPIQLQPSTEPGYTSEAPIPFGGKFLFKAGRRWVVQKADGKVIEALSADGPFPRYAIGNKWAVNDNDGPHRNWAEVDPRRAGRIFDRKLLRPGTDPNVFSESFRFSVPVRFDSVGLDIEVHPVAGINHIATFKKPVAVGSDGTSVSVNHWFEDGKYYNEVPEAWYLSQDWVIVNGADVDVSTTAHWDTGTKTQVATYTDWGGFSSNQVNLDFDPASAISKEDCEGTDAETVTITPGGNSNFDIVTIGSVSGTVKFHAALKHAGSTSVKIYTGTGTLSSVRMSGLLGAGDIIWLFAASGNVGATLGTDFTVYDNNGVVIVEVTFDGGIVSVGKGFIAKDGATWYSTGTPWVADTFYEIKIMTNMTNHTYQLWIDGVLQTINGKTTPALEDANGTTTNSIRTQISTASTAAYLDDIVMGTPAFTSGNWVSPLRSTQPRKIGFRPGTISVTVSGMGSTETVDQVDLLDSDGNSRAYWNNGGSGWPNGTTSLSLSKPDTGTTRLPLVGGWKEKFSFASTGAASPAVTSYSYNWEHLPAMASSGVNDGRMTRSI